MQKLPLHGWLVIDKSLGDSSAKTVAIVKRLTLAAKVGHAGTLDPLATGVLPIALGEATKTMTFATDAAKSYRFTVVWGEARSTDDREGEVVATSQVRPTEMAIRQVLPQFLGIISQIPPIYSAIKVDGERAYALARQGEQVELNPRKVRIDALELVACDQETATFTVDCGKGTYVRALARDIAQALGTCAYVSELRRTKVGKFFEKDAISLAKLEEIVHNAELQRAMLPVEAVLDDILALTIPPAKAQRLRFGQTLVLEGGVEPKHAEIVAVLSEGKLVAVGGVENHILRPLRIFNH